MAMPALFLLSGYLLFRNYDAVGYKKKLISRILRLGLPLVVWDIIYVALYNLAGLLSPHANDVVMRLGLNTPEGLLNQLNPLCRLAIGPFWYVRAVLIFSIAAPVCRWAYNHIHWSLLLSACLLLTLQFNNLISDSYPMYGLSLFVLGGFLSYCGEDIVGWFAQRRSFLVYIGIVAIVGAFIMNVLADDISEPYGIVKLAGVAVIWCFADFITKVLNKKLIISYVMPAAFMIYALHMFVAQMVVHSVGKRLCQLQIACFPVGALAIFVCFFVTVLTCVVVWHALKRLCPKTLDLFDGKLKWVKG